MSVLEKRCQAGAFNEACIVCTLQSRRNRVRDWKEAYQIHG